MTNQAQDMQIEMRDRLRRIETRMTKFMIAQGFTGDTVMPVWDSGRLHIPSIHCSIADCLQTIPDEWGSDPVDVMFRGRHKATITKAG